MDGKDFAQVIVDKLDEMLEQCTQPLVMGMALNEYIGGQPYRLRYLRRALERAVSAHDAGRYDLRRRGRCGGMRARSRVVSQTCHAGGEE